MGLSCESSPPWGEFSYLTIINSCKYLWSYSHTHSTKCWVPARCSAPSGHWDNGSEQADSPAVQLKRPEFLPAPVSVTIMNEKMSSSEGCVSLCNYQLVWCFQRWPRKDTEAKGCLGELIISSGRWWWSIIVCPGFQMNEPCTLYSQA